MDWRRLADIIRIRARALFRRTTSDAEAQDEIAFHLSMQTQENIRSGMRPSDAEREARRILGSRARIVEDLHDLKTLPLVETLWHDLRYALRMLKKSPGFAAAALLTLALGIGANAAIFSVLNAVILRPLEYPAPAQLMKIVSVFPGTGDFWISTPEYVEFRRWTHAFSSVGAYVPDEANLAAPDRPRRIRTMLASGDLFKTLGVNADLGRGWFDPSEERPGAGTVAILSHDLWQSVFAGDRAIVGKAVDVDGVRRTIVGVMPRGFDVADLRTDLWLPIIIASNANRGSHNLFLIGRLANGVTLGGARAETENLLANWRSMAFDAKTLAAGPTPGNSLHAPDRNHRIEIHPLQGRIIGNAMTAVWVLQGAVVLVLLIACANLSTLLLSRAETRRKEFAVRSALGAARGRLLGQAVIEGCVLSTIGAALGIGVAMVGLRAMIAAYPDTLPRSAGVSIDVNVLVFTAMVALLTGVVFGIAPLLHLWSELNAPLKDSGTRGGTGRHALRRGLVAAEIALAVTLVVGAGLLLRTVDNLSRVNAGFNRANLVTFGVSLPNAKYPNIPDRHAFYLRLTERLASTPGVLSVALARGLPPFRSIDSNTMTIEGFEGRDNGSWNTIDYLQAASAGYVETMGIRIVEGRAFLPSDAAQAVALVNQTMARSIWPGQSPIGRRLRSCCNPTTPWTTIVGIVGDVKQGGVDQKTGTELYFNADRVAPNTINVLMRTTLTPAALAPTIQRVVKALDPTLPVIRLEAMDEVFEDSIGRPRLIAQLLMIFAVLALVLAAVGTYGVLSYMVTERRREIGIRMALGATRTAVMRMVLTQGLRTTLAGLGVGIAITLALGQVLSSLLFGVSATDPPTLSAVVALIGGVAFVACYVPGHIATRVDPMIALREE
jgi:putative ABC transport system permease protein